MVYVFYNSLSMTPGYIETDGDLWYKIRRALDNEIQTKIMKKISPDVWNEVQISMMGVEHEVYEEVLYELEAQVRNEK